MKALKSNLKRRERGSALLIVFLFAAMIAITLYMEMPVAAFEAQRDREQLLIDRGNEYAHAVKLFVRKFGQYPSSIDALENTNNMRFLRHRFKDPLTGKDEWRILHAGPGGQIIDSKVNPLGNAASGNNSNADNTTASNTASFASSSFGSSNFGSSNNTTSTSGDTVISAVPQRPPAVSASGNPSGQIASTSPAQINQNPMTPLLPSSDTANGQPAPGASNGTQPGASSGTAVPGASPMDTARNMLNNPNNSALPTGTPGSSATSSNANSSLANSSMGTMASGGIAGVASKAEGHSIKTVNDQSDYSLWEFYYDPTKDAMRGMTGAMANMQQSGGLGATSNTNTQQNTQAPSGTTPANSQQPNTPTPPPQQQNQ